MFHAMPQRDPSEIHRAATPLELFVDLASVIAIAAAAVGLHHAIAEAHYQDGIVKFVLSFFGIWWAWMNYTWFASAYDDDSVAFKISTFVYLFGALLLAAGVTAFFKSGDLDLVVAGYIIMRLSMVYNWISAALGGESHKKTCWRYAIGIAVAQIFWCFVGFGDLGWSTLLIGLFCTGIIIELLVPWWAESANETPWHHHHIIERYGLLNIIVLGELLLAVSMALQAGFSQPDYHVPLLTLAISASVITFSMWWLYFTRELHLKETKRLGAFVWGYGHFFIFGGAAAAGAGLALMVDVITHHAHTTEFIAHFAVATPVAIYLFGLWLVRDRVHLSGINSLILLATAALAMVTPFLTWSIELLAVLLLAAVVVRTVRVDRANS